MSSQGPNLGSVASGHSVWTSPDSALSASDSGASAAFAIGASGESASLLLTGFGFSIPAGSTVLGIEVTAVYGYSGGVGTGQMALLISAYLTPDSGSTSYGPKSATVDQGNGSPVNFDVGSPSDLWGQVWSPAQINSSGFGVAITANVPNPYPVGATISVDWVKVAVTYSLPSGVVRTQICVIPAFAVRSN